MQYDHYPKNAHKIIQLHVLFMDKCIINAAANVADWKKKAVTC